MSEPVIPIRLTFNAAEALATVREFAEAGRQSIEQEYASAVTKAAAKVAELVNEQRRLGDVIKRNTAQQEELRQAAERFSVGDKQAMQQQIAALDKINALHKIEIASIEDKRIKLVQKGAAAGATTDAEKAAIQALTDKRLIENSVLKDTLRSMQAVKDAAAASSVQQHASLDALNRRESEIIGILNRHKIKLSEVAQQQLAANGTAKAALDAEAEGLQKAITNRQNEINSIEAKKAMLVESQQLLASTSDAERDSIRATTDQKLRDLEVDRDQVRIQESVRKATETSASGATADASRRAAALDALNRKEVEHRTIIDAESRQLDELRARRETATGAQLKSANQESESLRKLIENRRQEVYDIELKRLALEEEESIANAASEQERDGIRQATQARMIEIGIIRDQSRAQNAITNSISESESAVTSFARQLAGAIGVGTGIGALVMGFREVAGVIRQVRDDIIKAEEAAQHFRDQNASIFDKTKDLFNEMGVTDPSQQRAGEQTLNSLSVQTGIAPSQIAATGAALAPLLKQNGITDINGDRFKDVVGQASIFTGRGLMTDNIRDFTQQFLTNNPNASGSDINKALSGVVAATGSPQMANNFLGSYAQTKGIADEVGMNFGDVEKLYVQLSKNKSLSPQEIPELVRQYMTSSSRLRGLTPQELEGQVDSLGAASGQHAGVRKAMAFFQKAIGSGKGIDIGAFQSMLGGLNSDEQAIVMRSFGGPRGLVALQSGSGWQGVNLPIADITGKQTNPDALKDAERERSIVDQSLSQPTTEGGTYVATMQQQEMQTMQERADLYGGVNETAGHGANDQNAWSNVRGKLLIRLARLSEDIASGRVQATDAQKSQLQGYMSDLRGSIQNFSVTGKGAEDLIALSTGTGTDHMTGKTYTRADVLGRLSTPQGEENWLRKTMGYDAPNTAPDQAEIRRMDKEATFEQSMRPQPRPAPATQPMSVNYHQRIVNYGYGADSIGAPEGVTNNYG